MTRPLHVVQYPGGRDGCAHYRMQEPARVLADDPTVDVACSWNPIATNPRGIRLSPEFELRTEADVVVMQRPMHQAFVESIPSLQRRGVAVVVEVDDDFTNLPFGHPSRAGSSPGVNPIVNRRWLATACEIADHVIVSTPTLAAIYGSHGRCSVIRNTIPSRLLTMGRPAGHDRRRLPRPPVIGWTGSPDVHVKDLSVVGDGIVRLFNPFVSPLPVAPSFFHVGTDSDVVAQQLGLPLRDHGLPFIGSTGWLRVEEYYRAYSQLDVALCPLFPNKFNESKSWLKALEAAALAVSSVSSPSPEYLEAAEIGFTHLATTPDEWFALTAALVRDPALAWEDGQVCREIASELTIERHAHLFRDAWFKARDFRSSIAVAAGVE